jgi:acyl-CoA hydrolase
VTEQGIAWLFGGSEREQAEHLIERASHPRARDFLREALEGMQLS